MKKQKLIIGLALALTASVALNVYQHFDQKNFAKEIRQEYRVIAEDYNHVAKDFPESARRYDDFVNSLGFLSQDIKDLGKILEKYTGSM